MVGINKKIQEDGQDSLPPLPCGGDPVGINLQVENDRGGIQLPGLTEARGSVP